MRRIKHWTPRYILARLKEMAYQHRNGELPWLTEGANRFLQSYLLPSDMGIEFGSGRSTLWFASRISKLISVEHDLGWHRQVSESLLQKRLLNVDYRYLAGDENDIRNMGVEIRVLMADLQSGQFDFVLVDGVCRDLCTREAIRLLRPGGMLIIDNVNRHLPSASVSPHSRSYTMGPDGVIWGEIAEEIKPWRHFWTSSGVTDTAFYFKPINASTEFARRRGSE
jgi:predicted O-methyltransferase YrrM